MKYSVLLFLIFFSSASAQIMDQLIVIDTSPRSITIDSNFTGTDMLVFGNRAGNGDVVLIVRGPEKNITVRRKARMAGMWINKTEQKFYDVAQYYFTASSGDWNHIVKNMEQASTTPLIASSPLKLIENSIQSHSGQSAHFSEAFMAYQHSSRLYMESPLPLRFADNSLFSVHVPFPDKLPRGIYTAEAYLLSSGIVTASSIVPFYVYKSGFDAFVYDAAHDHPALYGLSAVFIAMMVGAFASMIWHRFYG